MLFFRRKYADKKLGGICIFIFAEIWPHSLYAFLAALDSSKRIGLGFTFIALFYFLILTKVRGAFLGFLIWIVVGRGLNILHHVAQQVRKRAPTYLDPVDVESIPSEIAPLISELNSLFERLQAAFEREKRFTADAAHELKTPLAALSAQTQVALRAQTELAQKEALVKVLFGVQRATHVIQQLLTLSRMEPHAALTDTAPLCLAKRAADVVSMLAPDALEKNIELALLSPDSTACIQGNITAIDILIRNLVDNAIRYSPEYSEVQIDIRATQKHVTLIVADNGPGIPKELRTRIFERFYRIMGSTAMGSGLGLSIVQQIAKLHQATVEIGQGIEFWVVFPKVNSSPQTTAHNNY